MWWGRDESFIRLRQRQKQRSNNNRNIFNLSTLLIVLLSLNCASGFINGAQLRALFSGAHHNTRTKHFRGLGDVLQMACETHDDCRDNNNNNNNNNSDDEEDEDTMGIICDPRINRCRCRRHYHAHYELNKCLPGRLLTFPCELDSQCQGRVQDSLCLHGRCACRRGTVAFRRHTCVSGAAIGQVCYGDAQCQLEDRSSFCHFVLRGVFGHCKCLYGEDENGGCKDKFEELASSCHRSGPCPGLPNSVCSPDPETGQASCQCLPGFFRLGKRSCISARIADNQINNDLSYHGLRKISTILPVSLGQNCTSNEECEAADENSFCDPEEQKCQCAAFKDENYELISLFKRKEWSFREGRNTPEWFCKKNKQRLCPEGTFQCGSTGSCISRYFVCDGKKHCDDGSDEHCSPGNCPKGAFVCHKGGDKCLSVSKVCDGFRDCPLGEDEEGCINLRRRHQQITSNVTVTSCPWSSFLCQDGSGCVPGYQVCNAHVACPDASDESADLCGPPRTWRYLMRTRWSHKHRNADDECPFRCDNGNCRSTDVVCSGSDGCGDQSDESQCQICKCPPK